MIKQYMLLNWNSSHLVENSLVKEKGCFTKSFAVTFVDKSNSPVLQTLATSMISAAS